MPSAKDKDAIERTIISVKIIATVRRKMQFAERVIKTNQLTTERSKNMKKFVDISLQSLYAPFPKRVLRFNTLYMDQLSFRLPH